MIDRENVSWVACLVLAVAVSLLIHIANAGNAFAAQSSLTITGKIVADGVPVQSVIVYANNGASRGYTNKDGIFTIYVPKAGTYTVTPFLRRTYVPTQKYKTVTVGATSITGIDFTLSPINTNAAVITGRIITYGGVPLPGVAVRTGKNESVITDANGVYSFVNKTPGRYFVFPNLDGYTFSGYLSEIKLRDQATLLRTFYGIPRKSTDNYPTFYNGLWSVAAKVTGGNCSLSVAAYNGTALIAQHTGFISVYLPKFNTLRGTVTNSATTISVNTFQSLCRIKGSATGTFKNADSGALTGTLTATCLTSASNCSSDVAINFTRLN